MEKDVDGLMEKRRKTFIYLKSITLIMGICMGAELSRQLDALQEIIKQLIVDIRQLQTVYGEIVAANKELRDIVTNRQFREDVFSGILGELRKSVLDELRRVGTVMQPSVLHEVVSVTPQSVQKSIERKGLTSPNVLIVGVLNRSVSPTELVYSLQAISAKQKQRLRGRVRDE